jgi:hypothetical protein
MVEQFDTVEGFDSDTREPFVTIYRPIAGWKSVLMVWEEELDMYTPFQTGMFGFESREMAVRDAKDWAEAEEIDVKIPNGYKQGC